MHEILFSLRFALLLVSLYGSIQYLHRHFRLEFCFGIYFSLLGSSLFLAGILNLLREASWAIFLIGLLLAARSVQKKCSLQDFFCPGTAFFLLFGVIFLVLLRGSILVHYDNFSHWGLVAKVMAENHRFPNFSDLAVSFTSYPLGSTVIMYYLGEILGSRAEWVWMYAQAMVMVGMLVGLFAFARGMLQNLAAAVFSLFLLCGNIGFTDLLVDSLLPITALGAAAACCYHAKELSERLWVLPVYGIFLLSIKNSGVLFALALYCLAWLLIEKRSIKTWLLLLLPPAATLLLWQKHVSLVFSDGLLSKHSMSPRYLYRMLLRKPVSQLLPIVREMARAVFTPSNPFLYLLLFGSLVFLAAGRMQREKRPSRLLLLAAGSYLLYQLGTLGMYLFSMPLDEALRLAGYARYHQSILMFTAGLLFLETLLTVNALPEGTLSRWLRPAAAASVTVLCWFCLRPELSYFRRQDFESSERFRFARMVSEYDIRSHGNYLFLVQQERMDYGYLYYLLQYELAPQSFQIVADNALDTANPEGCHYVIAYEHSSEIDAFMASLGADGESVVCLRIPEED